MCSTIAQMNEEFSFNGKLEEHLRIGFNLEFLSEALKSMEGDEVSAWVVGHLSPVANAETCVGFVNFQLFIFSIREHGSKGEPQKYKPFMKSS